MNEDKCLCAGRGMGTHGTFRAAVECKDRQIAQLTERLEAWRTWYKAIWQVEYEPGIPFVDLIRKLKDLEEI